MAEDWFRTPDWADTAQEDFEQRLSRARSHNRSQYLRIKGLALRDAGKREAAKGLWLRILADQEGYPFEQATTKELLGDIARGVDNAEAESYYRRLLAEHPDLNGTTQLKSRWLNYSLSSEMKQVSPRQLRSCSPGSIAATPSSRARCSGGT